MKDKKTFRKEQIESLTQFAKLPAKKAEDQILAKKLLQSQLMSRAQKVAITFSMPLEVDTAPMIKSLWQMGKEVYIPRVLPHRQMEFTLYEPGTKLTKSKFGVFENWNENVKVSSQIDLMVVPGLAFSLNNNERLGFGGGYYDRYLAQHDLETVALVNSKQVVPEALWPVESFDINLKHLILANED
ncbi:5-formyltetrahydrofolate cyclo-ligase [Lactobacillus sp. PV034]|uniref:5-formyltetrahydrofolate cyclo-ligase n=1 Tax=Lactobacillus sp. PV034 TaxID=2594495 RepID=UPI00223F6317|nr:5-formyltetrahydrofolate cyclo-ligase [Lactobacillus sp. PV034]QNQ80184.1 5-formyltetrahydrofolate cyclo-ligase [Lactobacillus sp. PV034]